MTRRRANGEGSVFRDKQRGGWIGMISVDGRRRKVTARTRTDVLAKLAALRRAGDDGVATDGNATVATVIAEWRRRVLPNRRGRDGRPLSPSAAHNLDWALRILTAELGNVRMRTLDASRIEKTFDRIAAGQHHGARGKPTSLRTLQVVRSTLVSVLDFAVGRRLIAYNPARVTELPDAPHRVDIKRALTAAEAETLWDACQGERLGNLYRLLLCTGMRPGEALGLCWDAVDLDEGVIHVKRIVRRPGGRMILADTTKTGDAGKRTIKLPAPAWDVLVEQRTVAVALQLASSEWVYPDLVFPTATGRPWGVGVRTELARICARAGLWRVRPNELRHSVTTILLDRGVNKELIAELLGHADTTMIRRVYGTAAVRTSAASVIVMGDLFGG